MARGSAVDESTAYAAWDLRMSSQALAVQIGLSRAIEEASGEPEIRSRNAYRQAPRRISHPAWPEGLLTRRYLEAPDL